MLRNDYSWAENALGFWATLTSTVLAVTSLALRYVTNPISCWMPAPFTGSMIVYSHYRCFQKTEILDFPSLDMQIPVGLSNQQHTYHQWVPFFLGAAAILCLLPHVIWRMLSGFLWLDGHALVQTVADNQRQNVAGRHVLLRDSALMLQAGLKGGNWVLTAAATCRKLLAFVTCVVQLVLIAVLFKPQLSAAGKEEEETREEEKDYNASLPLPEHFLCDVGIRQLDSVQRFTLQCTMPLAQVYSKGFTFLFYFFLLLALCCALDLVTWGCRLVIPGLRDVSVTRYLAVVEPGVDPQRSPVTPRFLQSLGVDGRLLLAVTADHCGPLAAADLTNHLWLVFKDTPRPGHAPSAALGSSLSPHSPAPSVPPQATNTDGAYSGDPAAIPLVAMGGQK